MKKTNKVMNKIYDELERTPLIQVVCEKIGISRNTFYRWMKEDREFNRKVKASLSLGEGRTNDVAVSNVLLGVQNRDPMYTKYWLDRKHPDFRKNSIYNRPVVDREKERENHEQKVKEAEERIRKFQDKWFKKPE